MSHAESAVLCCRMFIVATELRMEGCMLGMVGGGGDFFVRVSRTVKTRRVTRCNY
jgi:hypothetical protein